MQQDQNQNKHIKNMATTEDAADATGLENSKATAADRRQQQAAGDSNDAQKQFAATGGKKDGADKNNAEGFSANADELGGNQSSDFSTRRAEEEPEHQFNASMEGNSFTLREETGNEEGADDDGAES